MKAHRVTQSRRSLVGLALLVASSLPLIGQIAPTPPVKPTGATDSKTPVITTTAPATKEEVLQLTPFSVTSEQDTGYLATNTLSGSRLNSSLKETPGVLDVLTKDFMEDIGATTLEQALAFSTNFAEDAGDFDSQGVINTIFPGSQVNVNFRTRGLGGTMARNYLQTDSRPAFYTVERIDNSSGPNAILFGLGSAGGVVNITTKRANLNRRSASVELLTDSENSRRATLDVNQVLIPKTLGLRLNGIAERTQKNRANFFNNTDGFQIASTWRPTNRTEARVEYERELTTGTVAYPGPHVINDYVSNWLARGSPVFDLPTNWETLTTAQRDAIANPAGVPKAFIYTGGPVSPIVVQNGNQSFIINAATSLFSNSVAGSNGAANYQTIDPRFFNPRGNINGPGGRKHVNREILSVAVDHKLTESIFLNLSASQEQSSADTFQAYANGAASGATIMVDANHTLPNSSQVLNLGSTSLTKNASAQVINPFAGQYFAQSRWLNRTQKGGRKIVQGSAAGQFDLGRWFGSHRVVGTTSYMESVSGSENFLDAWLYAPFNATPDNTNNQVVRRHYASPLDANNFYVPDWRRLPSLTWNHPTLGPLKNGWVTQGESLRTAHQFSYLAASQSHFFKNRLVVTAGYRIDDVADYVYGQKAVKPPGWEASNGLIILDRSNVTKTTNTGTTRTLGAVVNVTRWLSAYANKSTNFGPPRGNVVGPDSITPPNTQGKGTDMGLKFDLFDGKIIADVGYFETSNNNVTEVLTLNLNAEGSIRGTYNTIFPILANPAGTAPLFTLNDPAAAAALKAAYSELRPNYGTNSSADLLDQASSGYELRLTANPMKGVRFRATASKTERQRENLYKFTVPMIKQINTYITDLQTKNPKVNIGSLATAAAPTLTIANRLDQLAILLDNNIDQLGNNFGAGKINANFTGSFDLPGRLKGWTTTFSTRYKSGAYNGAYEVRTGGLATGTLLETVPIFGNSTIDYDATIRYRTRLKWFNKTTVSFQLNVFNVFDQSAPTVRRVSTVVIAPGAPAPKLGTYTPTSYFLRAPRAWTFTSKFDF